MLTYAYFGTHDLGKAIDFYTATLSALGMERCITGDPDWDGSMYLTKGFRDDIGDCVDGMIRPLFAQG
jgi:hypothetical protein